MVVELIRAVLRAFPCQFWQLCILFRNSRMSGVNKRLNVSKELMIESQKGVHD